ncbi:MAG: hypothetical protein HQ581_10740, partial [Planctomycetes bacterium]|nr:hypothetical protein [Planctomycetota bacterium]
MAYASEGGPDVTPDEAVTRLQEGNQRYQAEESIHPRLDVQRMSETTTGGQHPFATVITCSDSRVPVEHVFDQGVGDIFTIRVAGNVCDTDEIGSIEYGVDHLGTPVLVVLGHSHCGAVTAVVTEAELHGSIPSLVDNIGPAVEAARHAHPGMDDKELVPEAVKSNVWQSIDDLFRGSPATRKRAAAGTLRVVGAVYHIENGSIEWLGEHPEKSRLLAYTSGPSHGNEHGAVAAASHGAPAAAGHGAPAAAGHGDAQGADYAKLVVEHVQAAVLIDPAEMATLDTARHREVKVEAAQLGASEDSWSLLSKILFGMVLVAAAGIAAWKTGQFDRFNVGAKMYLGFGAVVGIVLLVGISGWLSLSGVNAEARLEAAALDLDMMAAEMGSLQNEFLLVGIEDKARGEEVLKEHTALVTEFTTGIDEILTLDLNDAESGALAKIQEATANYDESFAEITAKYHEIEDLKETLDALGEKVDTQLATLLHEHEKDLEELETTGASAAEIAMQTQLIEAIAECELLAVRLAHAEIEFLLDKRIDRIATMEKGLGELHAYLTAIEHFIPKVAKDKHEEEANLELLAEVEKEIEEYSTELSKIIQDELIVGSDLVKCNEDIQAIGSWATALAANADKRVQHT